MAASTLVRGSLGSAQPSRATPLRHIDWVLVIAVTALSLVGAVMVFAATRGPEGHPATTYFLQRQLLFVVIGLGIMAVVGFVDYHHWRDWAIPMAAGVMALLLLVVSPLGSANNGAQSWFQIMGFQLQPSELAKLVFITGFATFLTFDRTELDVRRLIVALGIAAVPMALIMLQPDLGTVLVFAFTALGMLLVAGARPRHFAVLALVAIIGVVGILNSGMLAKYQKDRLTSFVNASGASSAASYNTNQSQIAIGSGGTTGQGLFHGKQTGLDFVPEQHTDFIFTVVGEELGLTGGVIILGLLGLIVWRVWRTAHLSRDPFGMLVCAGVLSMFMFQIFENAGMTMGIMPVTGIPLPFMSYGGSSTLTEFAAMGLVLSVHMRRFS